MAGIKSTDATLFAQKGTQGWGTHKCHTFPPQDPGRRKRQIKVADVIPPDPPQRFDYQFTYSPLIEFQTVDQFCKEIQNGSTSKATQVSLVTHHSGDYAILRNDPLREQLCSRCPITCCDHSDSFSKIYEVEYSVTIKECPLCGGPISKRSNVTTGFAPVHDVRLAGHPAILRFQKKHTWYCQDCKHVISGLRIPGLQHVLKGELTLRLLRSLFELSLDKVPTAYVAEGYGLSTDRVGALSRQFKTRAQEEYQSRLLSIFSNNNYSAFHDEPVYIHGDLFRAIFTSDKKKLLAILSEDEIKSVYNSLRFGSPQSTNYLTSKSFNLSVNYCLTTSPPLQREVLSSTLNFISTLEREQATKPYSGSPPSFTKLFDYLCDISAFRLNLDDFYQYLLESISYIPASFTASSKQLNSLLFTLYSIRMDSSAWYSEVRSQEKRTFELQQYYCGEIDCLSRMEITELIENSSRKSDFPVREQLARLQYYNEPSIFPTLPLEQQAFPVFNEAGWPSFDNSLLGTGIPVECLNHLLNNGLLQKTTPPPLCIRHRLGLWQHSDLNCCCTIKACPFDPSRRKGTP